MVRRPGGFTLIEVLIALSITAFISAIIIRVKNRMMKSFHIFSD